MKRNIIKEVRDIIEEHISSRILYLPLYGVLEKSYVIKITELVNEHLKIGVK